MEFYIAGRYEQQTELRKIAEEIETLGERHWCTSEWLYSKETEPGIKDPDGKYIRERTEEISKTDLTNIEECDTFILYDDGQLCRGGRNVEFGYALALSKYIVRVGPPSNIFTDAQCHIEFETWHDCLEWVKKF
jgi:nucleoside 2-deoxyribosyltransferase